nr:hypothetical protein [Archaeoglobus fulgidus]
MIAGAAGFKIPYEIAAWVEANVTLKMAKLMLKGVKYER